MKKIRLISLALLICLALPACGGDAAIGGKVIKIAMYTQPDSLNYYKSAASDTQAMMLNVHRGLVFLDDTGKIIPAVAKSWEISPDGLVYDFALNENVIFHNGAGLTSEDAVYSIGLLAGLSGDAPMDSRFAVVSAIEKEGDYAVKIMLKEADASFLSRLITAVLPKGYDNQDAIPIGCGPFKFVSYTPGESLILERFDDYFDKSAMPKIDRCEFMFISDANAQITALQTGRADIANIPLDNVDSFDDAKFTKIYYGTNTVQGLYLNCSAAPFDDPRVRLALNLAIDRQAVIDMVSGGRGLVCATVMSPSVTAWYDAATVDAFPYDPQAAGDLLAQAGFADGFGMEITVPSNYAVHMDAAQIIADQLSRIGVRAVIKPVEWAVWMDEVYGKSQFQATVSGYTGKPDPYDIFVRFTSGYPSNYCKYNNPEYDSLAEESRRTVDTGERVRLYNQIQELFVRDAIAVCIQDIAYAYVTSAAVTGLKTYTITFIDLSALDID